jgi:hypothetical protein
MTTFSTYAYKQDALRLKSNTNLKTDLLNANRAELALDLKGKKAKEKDGSSSKNFPSDSFNRY